MQYAREHGERQQHSAAAEISDRIDGGRWFVPRTSIAVEGARKRDVIDVVPGGLGIGPGLAPAGHSPIDEAWIVIEQNLRTESQPFHDPRTKTLDQPIGGPYELARDGCPFRLLEIDDDR